MPWRLEEPVHQQAWYWPPKLEYSASSFRRVNVLKFIHLHWKPRVVMMLTFHIWKHHGVSFWQPMVPTVTTKSASWWILPFSADAVHFSVRFMFIVATNDYIIFMHIIFCQCSIMYILFPIALYFKIFQHFKLWFHTYNGSKFGSSLCLQMSWDLMVLGHQHCWYRIDFMIFFPNFFWLWMLRIYFIAHMATFWITKNINMHWIPTTPITVWLWISVAVNVWCMSKVWCKRDVTTVHLHWSYVSFALTHTETEMLCW